jgi:hypothetical protein
MYYFSSVALCEFSVILCEITLHGGSRRQHRVPLRNRLGKNSLI